MATWTQVSAKYIGGPQPLGTKMIFGTLALSTEGGTANDIPASLFGLGRIFMVSGIGAAASGANVAFMVETDQEGVLTINLEQGTDATRGDPANVTGTYSICVIGDD